MAADRRGWLEWILARHHASPEGRAERRCSHGRKRPCPASGLRSGLPLDRGPARRSWAVLPGIPRPLSLLARAAFQLRPARKSGDKASLAAGPPPAAASSAHCANRGAIPLPPAAVCGRKRLRRARTRAGANAGQPLVSARQRYAAWRELARASGTPDAESALAHAPGRLHLAPALRATARSLVLPGREPATPLGTPDRSHESSLPLRGRVSGGRRLGCRAVHRSTSDQAQAGG